MPNTCAASCAVPRGLVLCIGTPWSTFAFGIGATTLLAPVVVAAKDVVGIAESAPRDRVRRIGNPAMGPDAAWPAGRAVEIDSGGIHSDPVGVSRCTPWSNTDNSAAFFLADFTGASDWNIDMPAERLREAFGADSDERGGMVGLGSRSDN